MKSPHLQLILPVLLASFASGSHATPKPKASPKAAAKQPAPKANPAQTKAQFERIAKAYSALGAFSVTALDSQGMGKEVRRTKSIAYFGADGRLGLKLAQLDDRGQLTGNNLAQLYDGQNIILSINGEPEQRDNLKQTGTKPTSVPITDFFSNTFGGQFIGVLSKHNREQEGYRIYGTYSVQSLPGGKTRIQNVTKYGSGKEAGSGTTTFIVGASGFVESIEASGVQNGRKTFHATTKLSRPTALSAAALTWDKFGPPPNPNFSIDAPSREVFERAAKLYGEAKSFATKISGTVQHSDESKKEPIWTADISWERRGRLRLQSSRSSMVYSYDGTNSYVISEGSLRKVPTFATTPTELTFQLMQTTVPDDDPFEKFNSLLVNLLQGETVDFTRGPRGIDARKVTLEADETLYDLLCKVVKTVATVKSKTEPVTLEERYWFAESDGRLLRVTTTLKLRDSQSLTDVRLNEQKIDVQLPDSTWVLTAPEKK